MLYYYRCIQDVIKKLMYILNKRQKKYSIGLLLLTLIGAIFETLGVSIIIPLVTAMISPEILMENQYLSMAAGYLGISEASQFVLLLGIGVVLIYIFKNIYLTALSYARIRYASKVQRELSVKMMYSYMKREYSFFLNVNTSDLLRGTNTDVAGVYQVIYQGFRLATESITIFCICIFIMGTDFILAFSVILVIIFCLVIVLSVFKTMMKKMGKMYRESSAEISKHSYEAFQGIKEISVMHRQKYFIKHYEEAYKLMQKANVGQVVAAESPAYIIEGICVSVLILTVCFRMMGESQAAIFLPQLASFAIAAFRILPSLGRISSSFNQFIYYCPSVTAVYDNVKEADDYVQSSKRDKDSEKQECVDESKEVNFVEQIQLKNVCWHYKNAKEDVLHNLNITIGKGESVAFIGASGAGKTTLADVILGLLHPQNGTIEVDGMSIYDIPEIWCRMIGYVPQAVYLTDDTIRNNIAFGIEKDEINDQMIWEALEQAQMKTFIEELDEGLDTIVGERGIRFSGGQRQRIAIARALYFNPDILVLDEATSALDTDTETAVMESIEALQGHKTLIIVAHRLTTIRKCDKIYRIADGKAIECKKEDVICKQE